MSPNRFNKKRVNYNFKYLSHHQLVVKDESKNNFKKQICYSQVLLIMETISTKCIWHFRI